MFDEQPDGDPHGECALAIKTLQARIAELEAQVDALKVDAERWKHCVAHGFPISGPQCIARRSTGEMVCGATPQDAVDAAMKEATK